MKIVCFFTLLALVATGIAMPLRRAPQRIVQLGGAQTSGGSSSTLQKQLFANATERHAICNDGTPSGYYINLAPGSSQWLIFLEGGYWCFNEDSCKTRQPALKSSNTWPSSMSIGGVFARDSTLNPHLHNANQMFVKYCTSDQFSGVNTDPSSNPLGWTFQGRAVMKAAVDELFGIVSQQSLPTPTEVVLGGCSAGGQAVVNNADYVGELVKAQVPSITYTAFMDAGWMTSPTPYWTAQRPMGAQMDIAIALWKGVPDESCTQSNPQAAASCYLSPVAVKYIETRFMMHSEQDDMFQLPYNIGSNPPYNASVLEWAAGFRTAMQQGMAANVPPQSSYWSGACYGHCVTVGDLYWGEQMSDGQKDSMRDAMERFFSGAVIRESDMCQGFNCSVGCSPS